MDVSTFFEMVKYLGPKKDIDGKLVRPPAILIRGRHAIGKSSIVKQLAKQLGKKLIDRRIGQMTEGDMIGLPITNSDVTKWLPVDFIKQACDEGVVLFLDEGNRATREVMQLLFQLCLDYELNGNQLHPETIIVLAVNDGAQYQTTKMDPALRDRFWTVDLNPTLEDWIAWGRQPESMMHPLLLSWIIKETNNGRLETETIEFQHDRVDPKMVTPSRRSWHMFSQCAYPLLDDAELMKALRELKDGEDFKARKAVYDLYSLGSGFVGGPAISSFITFLREECKAVTAEDVLNDWKSVETIVRSMKPGALMGLMEKIIKYFQKNDLTKTQALDNFAKFFDSLPSERAAALWMQLCKAPPGVDQDRIVRNIVIIHGEEPGLGIRDKLVNSISNVKIENGQVVDPNAPPAEEETAEQ